ncbi:MULTISPECIES: nucleoside deaminase [unclassified Wenzhouxiangella]|uniref:nucleoside deaminase n=1 Tax=unclassified Wenzhouxiangella TaxID=2613841 RepID=UPI000E32A454|nr:MULTISPECIES: nucleoside deaminase [unclassified Wenzhouxiangella]RFF28804.1 nucleoside deaminase [Wenzhouxiangella sp. 15181]RFP68219.1 nucleoside deaminase [Wenzhouxiangella sp. 15190]
MDEFMDAAIAEARQGLAEGGIPIGSVLVHEGRIIGRGHNRRVQSGSVVLHGEMDALENAGRQPARVYRECTLYTTLSPCPMCSGAILLYGIPRVVIGENRTFKGDEDHLRAKGVDVTVIDSEDCVALMRQFIENFPELWNEDIGE